MDRQRAARARARHEEEAAIRAADNRVRKAQRFNRSTTEIKDAMENRRVLLGGVEKRKTQMDNNLFQRDFTTANNRATNSSFRDRTSVYRKTGASAGGLTGKEAFRQRLDKLKFNESLRDKNRFTYDEIDPVYQTKTGKKLTGTYETPEALRKRMFSVSPPNPLAPTAAPARRRSPNQKIVKGADGVYRNVPNVIQKPKPAANPANPAKPTNPASTKSGNFRLDDFWKKKKPPATQGTLLNP